MLTITVRLFRRSFHGLREHGGVDWPPSPARLVGALLAGTHRLDATLRQAALSALAKIAHASAPTIDAPQAVHLEIPDTYTEATWIPDKAPNRKELAKLVDLSLLDLDSVSRVAKPQDAVALADDTIHFEVDVDLEDEEVAALDLAAANVPYFGRSNDPAEIYVRTGPFEDLEVQGTGLHGPHDPTGPLRQRWFPVPSDRGLSRGWQSNTIAWYDANHARTLGDDAAAAALPPVPALGHVRPLTYARTVHRDSDACTVIPLDRSLPHHHIPAVFTVLNTALRQLGGWLAFPATVSNSVFSDGRCVGIGLTPLSEHGPASGRDDDRVTEAASVVENALASMPLPSPGHGVGSPAALTPRSWTRAARVWSSTTPLRAYPDDRVLAHVLNREAHARFGTGLTVRAATVSPTAPYHSPWPSAAFTDGHGQWWLTLEFDTAVEGPVILGSSTESGHGVFRPEAK